MREKILQEIEDILCDYYEAATDGRICDEEMQKLMGNSDWADLVIYRIFATLFPDNVENRAFCWDSDEGKEFTMAVKTRPEWVSELMDENETGEW